jgi:isopenicillin N synthase-like dioxygenase
VEWADLVTLDLSQFDAPGGKQKLANQLRDAVHKVGFFYVSMTQH